MGQWHARSACLAAHTNKYGAHVPLSVLGRDASGRTLAYSHEELHAYPKREACFFGNLFRGQGSFVGSEGHLVEDSQSSLRACSLASSAGGARTRCDPLQYIGHCSAFCTRDASHPYYTSCTYNGRTWRPLTTRLRDRDIYACGDGTCQPTESCGTSTRYDSCRSDCGTCPRGAQEAPARVGSSPQGVLHMGDDRGELEPGVLLDNRYEVVRKLAEGGMATIYLVRHLGLQSQHALKVPSSTLFQSPEARQRFTTEARIQALLRHPHIAQVTDIVVSPLPGLVMEYVEGGTLGELCAQSPGGRLPLPVLRDVFLPVLDAMEAAHGQRVVHRDLTPGNILLARGERGRPHPKVTDFGIAKVGQEEPSQKYRTRTGALLGTRPYMSPEQIRGAAEVDARTDIFALGAILYEAATGLPAFDADSDFELMKRITEGRFVPPEQVVHALPPALCQCIREALAVDPAERFPDCAAFRAALEPALEVPPPPAQPLAPVVAVAPTPTPPTPGRWRSALGLMLLLGVSGLLFVNWLRGLHEVDRLKEEHGRLQYSEQAAQKDLQQLTQERDEARAQASQAGQEARALQERNQQLEGELPQHVQRIDELQRLQAQSLKFMEYVLLETAVRNALPAARVVKLCNQTDAPVSYQLMDENLRWSAQRELGPQDCEAHELHGSQPRVPVRFFLTDGVAQQADAMAGVVLGRLPEPDADWKPWENQLFTGPDGALQLKWAYRELPSLGSVWRQP